MPSKPLSVLYVSSEVYPFAKTGGLADVSFSLPIAIRDLGHDIRVMLPKYGNISERKNRIHEINRLRDIPIPVGEITEPATVKSSSINNPRTKVQAYVTTNFNFFDAKKGLYADPVTGEAYNNDERFIFFARTVIQTCLLLGWFPDIIHCNGWQTGLLPAYLRTIYAKEFANTKILYTIHNFSDQGIFPASSCDKTGLPTEVYPQITHDKKLNFLKAGISFSDALSTVSPTYAKEMIKDKEIGGGLHTALKNHELPGIINGIDLYGWMPKSDIMIAKQYDANTWQSGKAANKEKLLQTFELQPKESTPVIGMISRLSEAKGIPLFLEAAADILKEDVQIVFLGDGDTKMKKEISKIAAKFKGNFSVKLGFDDELAHLIEAGSDMFLMPSHHEPCGLNQMYSMMYGTVPIVRSTGGLADTVNDYDPKKSPEGNGIVFKKYEAADLVHAVHRAVKLYGTENWETVVRNGLSTDFSWSASAKKYDELYRSLMDA
ncbi:MAG: glycogen synthase [Candidatus Kapaibacterium sp.]